MAQPAPHRESSIQASPRGRGSLSAGAIALITLVSLSVFFFAAQRIVNRDSPLLFASMQLQIEITEFHLWLEEYAAGDRWMQPARMWERLDEADAIAARLDRQLIGPNLTADEIAADPSLAALRRVQRHLGDLRALGAWRIEAGEEGGIASQLDQQFDGVYTNAIQDARELALGLNHSVEHGRRSLSILGALLIGVLGLGAIVLFVMLRRHERQMARSMALNDQVSRYHRVMFEQNAAINLVVDRDTSRIVDANQAAARFYGASVDTLKTLSFADLFEGDGAGWQAGGDGDEPAAGRRAVHRTIDGRQRYVEIYANVARLRSDDLYFIVIFDITTRREIEVDLIDARDRAESASRAKSAFLAVVTHELRTPLNAILGFSEMIAAQDLGPNGDATYAEYGQFINESGQRLLGFVNAILDISRIESGGIEMAHEAVDVVAMAAEVTTGVKVIAEQSRIVVRLVAEPELPKVRCDPGLMRQALTNLVDNAIKFSPRDSEVSVACRRTDTGVTVQIVDHGRGIAEQDMETALMPFGQINPNRAYTGIGLGLPLAKTIVESSGGIFTMHSTPGIGTTISIILPAELLVDHAQRSETTHPALCR